MSVEPNRPGGEEDHHFGGAWTKLKLDLLDQYLGAWQKVMLKQRFQKIYVDGFAGSGRVRLKSDKKAIAGSAEIALRFHSFDEYFFFDKNRKRVKQLQALASRYGKAATVQAVQGDANELIQACMAQQTRAGRRGVVFLDPYGLQLEWSTLESIARTEMMDVWYLFPLSGVYRNAPISADRLDESKSKALDRILGTPDWRTAMYQAPAQGGLFSEPPDQREMDVSGIKNFVTARLRTVFPAVCGPRVLFGPNNAPLFTLYCCISNPDASARGAASRIANHLLVG